MVGERVDGAGLACVLALAAAASRAGRTLAMVRWPEGLRSLAEVCDAVPLLDPTGVMRNPAVSSRNPQAPV